MPSSITKHIYDFKLSNFDEVISVLSTIVSQKDLSTDSIEIIKTAQLILDFVEESKEKGHGGMLFEADEKLIRFLDLKLVENYSKHPEETYFSDSLFLQLSLIYTGLNGLTNKSEHYDKVFLERILSGELEYDELVFLNTIRYYAYLEFNLEANNLIAEIFFRFNDNLYEKKFTWEGALLSFYFLNFIWTQLPFLKKSNHELLFKNNFYFSVCINIPINKILEAFIYYQNEEIESAINLDFENFIFYLEQNTEKIPISKEYLNWEDLSSVIKDYLVQINSEDNHSFVRENIVNKFYILQKGKDDLSHFLRLVLETVSLLDRQRM